MARRCIDKAALKFQNYTTYLIHYTPIRKTLIIVRIQYKQDAHEINLHKSGLFHYIPTNHFKFQ